MKVRTRALAEVLGAELFQLPKADRLRVLGGVVRFDADVARDAALEAAWDQVAARRAADAKQDPSLLLPLDSVLAGLRDEQR